MDSHRQEPHVDLPAWKLLQARQRAEGQSFFTTAGIGYRQQDQRDTYFENMLALALKAELEG